MATLLFDASTVTNKPNTNTKSTGKLTPPPFLLCPLVAAQVTSCEYHIICQLTDSLCLSIIRLFIIYHLPNLRFLDSSPVHGHERDLALKRCYWMNRSPVAQQQPLASNNNQERELLLRANELPFENQAGNLGDERSTYNGVGVQTEPQTANNFQMTIMSDYVDNVNGLANLEVSNGQMASSMPAAGHLDDQHKGKRLAWGGGRVKIISPDRSSGVAATFCVPSI